MQMNSGERNCIVSEQPIIQRHHDIRWYLELYYPSRLPVELSTHFNPTGLSKLYTRLMYNRLLNVADLPLTEAYPKAVTFVCNSSTEDRRYLLYGLVRTDALSKLLTISPEKLAQLQERLRSQPLFEQAGVLNLEHLLRHEPPEKASGVALAGLLTVGRVSLLTRTEAQDYFDLSTQTLQVLGSTLTNHRTSFVVE